MYFAYVPLFSSACTRKIDQTSPRRRRKWLLRISLIDPKAPFSCRMRSEFSESSQRLPSRIPSITSSKDLVHFVKLNALGRVRKIGCERNVASVLLQQRQALRVICDKVDMTPKPLVHAAFSTIDENQMTALESIGLFQTASESLLTASPTRSSELKATSSGLLKSLSMLSVESPQMESLLSTQILMEMDEDIAPSAFFLSR